MTHGGPDYGGNAAKATIHGLQDMAELAARLGSIDTFDRRGDIIFLDDFSGGDIHWVKAGGGAGYSHTLSAEHGRSGPFALDMIPGPANNRSVYAKLTLALPVLGKLGFESAFITNGYVKDYDFEIDTYDGVNVYYAAVRYSLTDKALYYYDSAGDWVQFASDIDLYSSVYAFHVIKLVADLATGKYVRCILDSGEYDLSAIEMQYFADTTEPQLQVFATFRNSGAYAPEIYFTDVIVTQNEP